MEQLSTFEVALLLDFYLNIFVDYIKDLLSIQHLLNLRLQYLDSLQIDSVMNAGSREALMIVVTRQSFYPYSVHRKLTA